MNFLKHSSRAIAAYHQHSSNRYLLSINRSSLYSTSYHLNAPQITKIRRTRKTREPPSSSSPSTSSPNIKHEAAVSDSSPKIKHEAAVSDWPPPPPRPVEIPYQAKDANLVNIIGHIKMPCSSYTIEGGKYRAITFISQENGEKVFSIPIIFEDELAKVAAFHLHKHDTVLVKGQLSEDPIPFDLSQSQIQYNYHVLVQDIKFVAGFPKITDDDDGLRARNGFSIPLAQFDQTVRDPTTTSNDFDQAVTVRDRWKVFGKDSPKTLNDGKSEECPKGFETKKDRESDSGSWQDLVENSKQWLDFRDKKSKGSLTLKFPDFKHKDAGTSLWLTSAPKWVLTMLGNLEFCVNVPKHDVGSTSKPSKDEVWKSLVENPSLWWDNRLMKKNVKGPDFVHKETREGLWLTSSPDWVVSKLPPLR